jgi:hypothetical protein
LAALHRKAATAAKSDAAVDLLLLATVAAVDRGGWRLLRIWPTAARLLTAAVAAVEVLRAEAFPT